MDGRRWAVVCLGVVLAAAQVVPVRTQQTTPATTEAANDDTVPSDLRLLIAAPESELRLVVLRYNADRTTLNGNYDGGRAGGRSGRGDGPTGARGGSTPSTPPLSLSTNRIARLKRFDAS